MKPNSTTIFIVIISAIVGGLIGSRFQGKLDKKAEAKHILQAQTVPGTNDYVLPPQKPDQRVLNFLVRDQNSGSIRIEDVQKKLASILETKKFTIFFNIADRPAISALFTMPVNNRLSHIGVIDSTRFASMLARKRSVAPVFFVSPREGHSCQSELHLIVKKDSPINSMEDLAKKSVGISLASTSLAPILFKTLKEKSLKTDQVHIFSDPNWGTIHLMDGSIDALVDRVNVYEDSTVGTYGHFKNGAYPDFPNLKVVTSTQTKLPCEVLFIATVFSKEDEGEIRNKLRDFFYRPEYRGLIKTSLKIGSVKEVKPDEWKPFQDLLEPIDDFAFGSIAKEIVIND